jgi:hypothetical protein
MPVPANILLADDDVSYGLAQAIVTTLPEGTLLLVSPARFQHGTPGACWSAGDPVALTNTAIPQAFNVPNGTYYISRLVTPTEWTFSATRGGPEISFPTVTISMRADGAALVTWPNHGRVANESLRLAGDLPPGLLSEPWVKDVVSVDTFTLTNSSGGPVFTYPDCTLLLATPGQVQQANHGLTAGVSRVAFGTAGTLPTGLSTGVLYWVRTVLSSSLFTVSLTPTGTAITFGGTGGTAFLDARATASERTALAANAFSPTHTHTPYLPAVSRGFISRNNRAHTVVMPNGDLVELAFDVSQAIPIRIKAVFAAGGSAAALF